jgi:hypothetical protein
MKKSFIVLSLALMLAASSFAAGYDTQKLIPAQAVAVVTVVNVQSDAGVSWMLGAWSKSKRQTPLKDLVKGISPQELSVAFLPESKDSPSRAIAVIALAKGASPDKALLEKAVGGSAGAKLEAASYKGATVYSAPGPAGSPASGSDFRAYAIAQDKLVLGSDAEAVKRALDGPAVDSSADYGKALAQAPKGMDATLFAENAQSQLAAFLAPRQKKWNMELLLSADALAYVGASFDFASSSKLTGTIVFQAAKADRIADVKDDASFIGEAFKRKFLADKIQYSGKVDSKDNTVTLTFQMDGLEPLWTKLFDGGVLELFSPAS